MCGNEQSGVEIDFEDAYRGVPPAKYTLADCLAACATFRKTTGCTGIQSKNVCRVHVAGDNTATKAIVDSNATAPVTTYINPPRAARTYF